MKTLLVAEYRDGKLLGCASELLAFAKRLGSESAMFLVGSESMLPKFEGKLYLADVDICGEFNPEGHKQLLLEVIAKETPDMVVFSHSSYGWDLAPRIAFALKAEQFSEVIDVVDGLFVLPLCNSKLLRKVAPKTSVSVLTLQAGAFNLEDEPTGNPSIEKIGSPITGNLVFEGYEQISKSGIDLTKAEVIVSAGRGIGKAENMEIIIKLAEDLNGEFGASRPVVDAGWAEHNRQVGTTGQIVTPKLYIACGVSGAVQHLAGMKNSEFVVAINTDRDAPIGEVADVLVVADLKSFVPVLREKIGAV